jgi:hypothetical protein
MGIKPEKFGPYFWGALHLACLGDTDPAEIRSFVETFSHVIPCESCRIHFADVLRVNPVPQTEDSIELFNWSVDIHNIVNKRLNKPIMDADEAYTIWTSLDAKGPGPFNFILLFISLMVILIVIFMFLRIKK